MFVIILLFIEIYLYFCYCINMTFVILKITLNLIKFNIAKIPCAKQQSLNKY
jgi:hypothetical protein